MDLNTLAQAVVDQLTRIADAAQASVGGDAAPAAAAKTGTAAAKTGAAAGTKPAAGTKASAKPKVSRETMEKALLAIKDHPNGGKPAAQAVFSPLGYTKMTEIADKDFDKIFAAAEAALETLNAEAEESLENVDDDI